MKKTAIVVPCHNEAKRLRPEEFVSEVDKEPGLSFIFVDDGSTDGTGKILKELEEACSGKAAVVTLAVNSGKAEAVRQGVLHALKGDFVNIGYWDADLAIPLETIARFREILDGSERTVVLGAKVRLLGRHIERTALRHFLGRFFATLASNVLHLAVYDTQCGAKLFKKTESLARAFRIPFNVKWTFDVELLARLGIVERALGNPGYVDKWMEYPLEICLDVKGSKVNYTDFFKSLLEIGKIFVYTHVPGARSSYERKLMG